MSTAVINLSCAVVILQVQLGTLISVVIIIIGYCTYMLEPVREGERIRILSGSKLHYNDVINNEDPDHQNTGNTRINNARSSSHLKITSRTSESMKVTLTEVKML